MNQAQDQSLKSIVMLTNRVGKLLVQSIWSRIDTEEIDIQAQHMGVLSDLWEKDGIRQQDLAVSNIKDKATIARTISHLEQKNILVRIADEQDKRNKRIYLTHKGKSLRQKFIPVAEASIKDALDNVSQEELMICNKVLTQIYNNLNGCERNDN